MVTREEFLKAKAIVDEYVKQCIDDINSTTPTKNIIKLRDAYIKDNELGLSLRCLNALNQHSDAIFGKNLDRVQVKDLPILSLSQYAKLKNFGRRSMMEIVDLLEKAKLHIEP